jgi:hypothetical protein
MPKQQMIFAARAAGIMPLGFIASVAGFGDWEAFARMVRRSRRFGFMGASCIHPGQVPIVNREYSPSAEELSHARRVIEENLQAEAGGRASFAIDGMMIDVPVVRRPSGSSRAPRRSPSARLESIPTGVKFSHMDKSLSAQKPRPPWSPRARAILAADESSGTCETRFKTINTGLH